MVGSEGARLAARRRHHRHDEEAAPFRPGAFVDEPRHLAFELAPRFQLASPRSATLARTAWLGGSSGEQFVINVPLDDKPPPLAVGGSIWHPAVAAPEEKKPEEKKDEGKKDEPKKDDKPAPKPAGGGAKPTGKPGVLQPKK